MLPRLLDLGGESREALRFMLRIFTVIRSLSLDRLLLIGCPHQIWPALGLVCANNDYLTTSEFLMQLFTIPPTRFN